MREKERGTEYSRCDMRTEKKPKKRRKLMKEKRKKGVATDGGQRTY